ncbi:MAG TPA: prolyl oligopeptidase family serine peptidase [Verrucomicrobiae bacterium]|nr:prolyl oligopeptidase family serine peptidase [Verrucomicrobiae bacterium]
MFTWKRSVIVAAATAFAAGCATYSRTVKLHYPVTPTTNVVDNYHGTLVADPYRWLEDDNSPQTKAWVEAENKVTFAYLNAIPGRAALKARLTSLWNYERYGVPFKAGDRYFYSRNDGLQNQSVLYTVDSLNGEPRVLLDPNTLSKDGTVALAGIAISEDGNRMAYGLATAGSDWNEWKVRDVRTGQDLPDHLQWVKFSGASWLKDGSGFFYSRYDAPKPGAALTGVNKFQKLYLHKLGTDQSADELVYERKDQPDWGFGGDVTEDGRYLIITVSEGTDPKNRVLYRDLTRPGAPVVELLMDFDASYNFVGNDGPVFWFKTDLNAPRGRVIAVDVTQPARANWREVIPQSAETLQGVSVLNNQFVAEYLKDAHTAVKVFRLDGTFAHDVALPGLGTAGGFGGKRNYTETFYSFTSFTAPGTIYRYDLTTGESTVFRQPRVDFDADAYETRQVFYTSKDGTRVPMFIVSKRGLRLDGQNPTLLYGYGGFDISLTPGFSVSRIAWLEMGGVYALANLRGGGEYGEEWHQAGTKLHKQNVFDDFIGAAEWLIANHYTSPKKLAIQGGSNGGLLIGACMTQRPDLFGVALPAVGVMDMLRFHKFTIGWAWASDYGSSDDPGQFKALYAYSPYHNLKPGVKYPATLITTADHDDRVVPAHSFKFAARLQADQAGHQPVLIRIETKAGHGAGKPTTKLIEETTDILSFLAKNLGMGEPFAGRQP